MVLVEEEAEDITNVGSVFALRVDRDLTPTRGKWKDGVENYGLDFILVSLGEKNNIFSAVFRLGWYLNIHLSF